MLFSLLLTFGCVTAQKQQRAESRIMLGSAYLKEGDIPGAIGMLQEATQFNPRSAEAWEKLGLAYYAQGAPERAEQAFKRALKIEPDRAETNNNYALILLDQQRYDDAITHFEVASADLSYRNTAMVLSNLGRAHHSTNSQKVRSVALTMPFEGPPICASHGLIEVLCSKNSQRTWKHLRTLKPSLSCVATPPPGHIIKPHSSFTPLTNPLHVLTCKL